MTHRDKPHSASDSSESSKDSESIDQLVNTELGSLISSSLYKLEHISNHHVKERRRHFRITNIFVMVFSTLILIIAAFNLYYIYDFYDETRNIVKTVSDLDHTVKNISVSMVKVTGSMAQFKEHMDSLEGIHADVSSMSNTMPLMQSNMAIIETDMGKLNQNMTGISADMTMIDNNLRGMSGNVSNMGHNIYEMSKPAGKFNTILP